MQSFSAEILTDPMRLRVGEQEEEEPLVANNAVTQIIIVTKELKKPNRLKEILEGLVNKTSTKTMQAHPKVLIFVSRKIQCEDMAVDLRQKGYLVDSLHSGKEQSERSSVINAFKEGSLRLLVATDVAARGLDVSDVAAVINYDFSGGNKPGHPDCLQSYIHRIGRTARGGKQGVHILCLSMPTKAMRRA